MTLTELGWDSFFQNAWDAADRAGHFPARLIEEHKGACRLASERGDFLATVAGRLRFDGLMGHCWPAVGDWVEAADGVIYGLLPRRSKFSRKAAGKRTDEQVVAANVDTVLIVSAFGGDFKEIAYLARKQDVRLQIEENRKWKQIHKEQKRMYQEKSRARAASRGSMTRDP